MKRQEDHWHAIGKLLLKTSGAPYLQPLRAMQHESYFCFSADGSPIEDPAIGREAARPSGQPGCSSYFKINTCPIIISRQFAIRLSFSAICFIATEMLFLSQHVVAADWSIMPSLNLKETYSDNIKLAPPDSEKSEWVTEINPGISLTGTGSNLKVNTSYQMQNVFYAKDSNSNRTNHSLRADAKATLVDSLFFLDGNAGISQQNISLFGPQPDNINITGNRASVVTYSISPYLRHSFDAIASSELRYTHDEVRTRVSGLSNSKGDSALFNLISGSAFSRLGWGLHYSKSRTDYNNQPTVDAEIYSGDLRFPITPKFSLSATKGNEKYNYLSISGDPPDGHFWTAGFSWMPTARTSFDASTGSRFFGKTHSLAASHHSRNTVWSVSYSEDITSNRSQFLIPATINTAEYLDQLWTPIYPDPVLRKQIVDSFILSNGLPISLSENINYFTNRYFLQKRLQASVALNSAKSTLILSLFDTLRDAQTAQTMDSLLFGTSSLALNDNTKQIGGNAIWNWRFSPRTNINVSTRYTIYRSISVGTTERFWMMGLGMTRQFRPKLNGSIDLRRNQNHSDQIGGGYQENAITASLLIQF